MDILLISLINKADTIKPNINNVETGKCGENCTYKFDFDDCRMIVSGTGKMEDYDSNIDTPWHSFRDTIKYIYIEDGISYIGNHTFESCEITTLSIESSVSIGYQAFAFCCYLEECNIPNSVTYIGQQAFRSCFLLTSISIQNCAAFIDINAFQNCTKLMNITFQGTFIGESAFLDCTSLVNINLGQSVEEIGCGAFSGCASIRSVEIPDSVRTIGNYTFKACSSLESITIGRRLSSMGYLVFEGCSSLSYVYFTGRQSPTGQDVFHSSNPLQRVFVNYCYLDNHFCGMPISYLTSKSFKSSVSPIGIAQAALLFLDDLYY